MIRTCLTIRGLFVLAVLPLILWMASRAHAQLQPGPNISPNGIPFAFLPR
jgi:hypothetical protein